MIVQPELPAHKDAIRQLHVEAFPTSSEADLVEQLKADGSAVISLVALDDDAVVGHVLFSKMRAPFKALGLAPVSVKESHRSHGIAAALIEDGIKRAKAEDWDAIFVLGEPAYYQRFGFSAEKAAPYDSPYAGPYFMMLDLTDNVLTPAAGRVDYARAFDALG